MYRRIQLINTYKRHDDQDQYEFIQGLIGISRSEVADTWIDKLRGPDRSLPGNAHFYFTEKGWREVGRPVLEACGRSGQRCRVIRIKENEIDVVWRDKHTGFEVAGQPKRSKSTAKRPAL